MVHPSNGYAGLVQGFVRASCHNATPLARTAF